MKNCFTVLCIFVAVACFGQANKFEVGDFGMRYSVSFNGAVIQGLTLSGMVTPDIEVGCTVNVSYSKSYSNTTSLGYNYVYTGTHDSAVAEQTQTKSSSASINTSFSPYVYYHFRIKNNLDIYTGPNLIVGTGSHTLRSSTDQEVTSADAYSDNYTRQQYPLGYQIGGALNIGGQYFFYKRLAIGVQASIGVAYSSTHGNETAVSQYTSIGANNSVTANVNNTATIPYVSKSLSFTTASSIGIYLTYYLAPKKHIKQADKTM